MWEGVVLESCLVPCETAENYKLLSIAGAKGKYAGVADNKADNIE